MGTDASIGATTRDSLVSNDLGRFRIHIRGGTGGGIYRPGGSVPGPRVIKEVKPPYTAEALRRMIQGTVVLEVIVTPDGCATHIRVVQSRDRGGLDEEAISAVAQWRFEPGRLAGAPVDVLVTIMVDFSIR